MLLAKIPENLFHEIQVPVHWLLLSLLGAVVCITGSFLLMWALGEIYSCSREKILKTGLLALKESHGRRSFPCASKIVVPIG